MSARSSSGPRSAAPRRDYRASRAHRGPGAVHRRRRLLAVIGAITVIVLLVSWVLPRLNHAVTELTLPLSHADVIRQQAAAKHLDPALIAAVIFAETKFNPRTSPAGAVGLMQIEPATARFLAHLSHGYRFTTSDLDTPAVNVAYGSYYLRYLLDHYRGNEMFAVAAYNGGVANVDRWVAGARSQGRELTVASIPFPETQAYVRRVLDAQRSYRRDYPHQLGLS
jgi:peptidoglycan lytic transglycosylase